MDRRRFVGIGMTTGMTAGAASFAHAVSIETFGGAGDGESDATPAVRRAVESGQGAVYFPKGEYILRDTVEIELSKTGFLSLFGDGTARIRNEASGPAFHFIGTHEGSANPASFQHTVWQKERMPLVSGLEIYATKPDGDGICLEKTMQATLTNCLIRQCRVGLHLKTRNRNLIVSHCHFYENRDVGIWYDHVNLHQSIVNSNHISYNKRAGIAIEGGEVRNFQIVGNDIEYNHDLEREGSADIFFDVREEGSSFREGTIVGNTIQALPSPGGANIRILGGDELRCSGMLSISGNLIGSQVDAIHLRDCRGVAVSGNSIYSAENLSLIVENSEAISIAGNTIDWNPDHHDKRMVDGIAIRDSRAVQLSDTIIVNSFHGTPESGGTVEIERCEDVAVSDCQIMDAKHRGVEIVDSKRCKLSNNTILDRKNPVTMIDAIRIRGNSQQNLIQGNQLHRGKTEAAGRLALLRDNMELEP